MTDTQLIYFIKIVELGSFSETALELDISQSAISKQVMQLEDELGVKLFDRTQRKIRLTSAGEMLYEDAVSVLDKIEHLKETAKQLSSTGKNRITLLAIPVIGHFNFYIPVQLFESVHNDIHINIEELEEPEMYKKIDQGMYDAAITYYNPDRILKNAVFYPLMDDEMLLVCHKDHPLSAYDMITPALLDDQPVLAMQKYTCTNQLYTLYFRKHNSNPHIIFRGRPGTILVGAEANRGPALLSRIHTETLKINNVSLIPFSPPLKGVLGIIINERSRNAQILKELAASLSQIRDQ